MHAFLSAAKRFAQDDDGITAIEYGLIAALMAGAIGGIFTLLFGGLTGLFTTIAENLNPTPTPP